MNHETSYGPIWKLHGIHPIMSADRLVEYFNPLRIVAGLIVALAIISNPGQLAYAFQDDVPEFEPVAGGVDREERLQAGSLHEAFFSNSRGLVSGDVLIRQVDELGSTVTASAEGGELKLLEAEKELLVSETTFYRLRFDKSKGVYLFVRSLARDGLLLGEGGVEEAKADANELKLGAFVVEVGGKCITKHGGTPAGEAMAVDDDQALQRTFRDFKVPSINAAGIVTFGSTLPDAQMESVVARLASGDTICRIEDAGQGKARIFRDEKMSGGVHARDCVVFDKKELVPDSRAIFFRSPSGQWVFVSKEMYRWIDVAGMKVPVSIIRDYQGQKAVNGVDWIGRGVMRFEFHWFSVNEELGAAAFDAAILSDETAVIRLVDPVASNATRLLPVSTPPAG